VTVLSLEAVPIPGIPEIEPGADLAGIVLDAAQRHSIRISAADVLVFAQKVVSKAEGRLRALEDVEPGDRARALASELGKDPRLVQVILDESSEIVRAERGVLITRTRRGHVCANAGVDSSNVPGELVSLLPEDADESARRLRPDLRWGQEDPPAVIVSDSFGRPWRLGQTEVAIGCAGLHPLDDRRGLRDALGRDLHATLPAIADQAASAAGLVRSKDGREGVVVVRGLERFITDADGPGAASLVRARQDDLFLARSVKRI
jgi:coenzyme F420-0:L-glutamate ligase/coenzyme F420-1:gamma-L-glutamate ligase